MPFSFGGTGTGGGGDGAGLRLEEIGSLTPDWTTHSGIDIYAGDTSPGAGIAQPDRTAMGEIWALHFGDETVQDDNLRLILAADVPDSSASPGDTANDNNGAQVEVDGGHIFLTFGQGDTLLVARGSDDHTNAPIVTGEITLYRANPGNDDFARDLTASLAASNVLTVTLTRDGAANLSDAVDLSRLKEWRGEWSNLAGETLYAGDLVQHGAFYYLVRQEHTRSNSGPDTDPARFALLTNYGGAYAGTQYYHAGTIVAYQDGWWVNNADVVPGDPDPDATTNAKWIPAGLTASQRSQFAALPALWSAGTHSTGDQVFWRSRLYRCIADRVPGDTDNPATDSTGWSPVGVGGGGAADGVVSQVSGSVNNANILTISLARTVGPAITGTIDLSALASSGGVATNLAVGTRTANTLELTSSTGTNAELPAASNTQAGLASATDKTQLEALPPTWAAGAHAVGDQVSWSGKIYRCLVVRDNTHTDNPATDSTGWAPVGTGSSTGGTTNLGIDNQDTDSLDVTSSTGTDATLPSATPALAGLESAADKTQLDALPPLWAAGVHAVNALVCWNDIVYVCVIARNAGHTNSPATDTTGWRNVGTVDIAAVNARIAAVRPADRQLPGGTASLTQNSLVRWNITDEDLEWINQADVVPDASEAVAGKIEIADNTQAEDSTNDTHAMTPAKTHRVTGALVTTGERTSTTPASTVRRFTPADIVAMIRTHEVGGVTVADINTRIMALVEAWALAANANTLVPEAKIDAALTRDTELATAIANFQTAAQVNVLIATALAATGYVTDGGPWSDRTFAADTIVRHDGATYLSNVAVPSGTSTTTEPGVGGNWETYWDRLGYEDGPPNAFVGATRTDRTLTFVREGGANPVELTLPAGGESAYSYYQEFTDQTTPTFSLTPITTDTTIAVAAEYTQTLIDTMVPAGIDLAKPIVVDYHGFMLFACANNRETEVSVGYRLFAGTADQITFWRNWHAETRQNIEYAIAMDVFSTTGTLRAGTYPNDAGATTDLQQTLFEVPIPLQIAVRIRFYNRSISPPFSTRREGVLQHLELDQGGVIIYQLGAFEQTGTGSSRGLKLFTSNELTTTRGEHGQPIAGLTWTRNEAPDSWVIPSGATDHIRPPDLPHDDSVTGIWAVTEDISDSANPVEIGAARLPWGSADFGADTLRLADQEYIGISSRTDTGTGRVEYRFRWNYPDPENPPSTPGVADRRIVVYESVAGEKGDDGEDGSTNFEPDDLGEHTFNLAGAAAEVALADASNTAIICPADGYIIATLDVPGLGLVGAVQWMLAADLREAAADATLTAGLYTDSANQIFFHAGMQSEAVNGNTILIQHVGDTSDETGGARSTVLPSIARFEVTGDLTPPPGSIGGNSLTYNLAISQSGHASAARIVGFAGTDTNPSAVAVLRNVTNLHAEQGTVSVPAGTMLANAGDIYTVRLEVYGQGVALSDPPTAYHDARIVARVAATASVHFGDIPAANAAATITDFTNDITTAGSVFGDWSVTGISASDGDRRLYWLVPTSLDQPGVYRASGFDISSTVEAAVEVTINGVAYNAYLTEADGPYDSTSNGYTIQISRS